MEKEDLTITVAQQVQEEIPEDLKQQLVDKLLLLANEAVEQLPDIASKTEAVGSELCWQLVWARAAEALIYGLAGMVLFVAGLVLICKCGRHICQLYNEVSSTDDDDRVFTHSFCYASQLFLTLLLVVAVGVPALLELVMLVKCWVAPYVVILEMGASLVK